MTFSNFSTTEALNLYNKRNPTPHNTMDEIEDRISYKYAVLSGGYDIPNSYEGDIIRLILCEIIGRRQNNVD